MTPDERRAMALLGALEALRSGTTLVLEDTNDVDDYAEALAGTGMRFLLSERARPRRHVDRRSCALQARPRAGTAPSQDHRGRS